MEENLNNVTTNENVETNNTEPNNNIDIEKELERKNMELELEYHKKLEQAKQEQEKLSKMNDLEKREYEYNKMKEELERLKQEQLVSNLTVEAKKILGERNVPLEFADFCIGKDAKETKSKIDNLTNIFNKAINEAVNNRLLGNNRVPTNGNTNYGAVRDLEYYKNNISELAKLSLEEQAKILLKR